MLQKKVLFIDDDTDIQEIIVVILEREGIGLIKAFDTPCLAEITKVDPDVILLDEWLPHKNGSLFCAELKAEKETSHIPVVLISAVCDLETIAKKCHADAFISKPFDIDNLIQILNSFLIPKEFA